MDYQVIDLKVEGQIAVITLNRPPMNPLNSQMVRELDAAAEELKANQSVRAVIITGAGDRAFCAGADVAEMINLTPVELYEFSRRTMIACGKLENLNKPTIAAINGLALGGGCEISLLCDFRIAADNAKFGQPEINLGIIPGGGGTQRLPRLIGMARAKELLFLGNIIDAATAERYGLVNKVVPAGELMEEARKLAEQLAGKPPVAMRILKETINTGINMDLNSGLSLEGDCFGLVTSTEDAKEGMKSLLEKRKPEFKGR